MPRDGVKREDVMRDIETVMRIRHRLKLHQPNDFDVATQDMAMKFFDQLTWAIYLALVVISSIALMVGGIGVMAIMTISVTERTREIGVRKAIGARRREILYQFLLEAVVLTSLGGISASRSEPRSGSASGPHSPSRLDALVVVRPRLRVLGRRRHLLRALPGVPGVAPGPDRGAPVR